jgi:hypothetical protein
MYFRSADEMKPMCSVGKILPGNSLWIFLRNCDVIVNLKGDPFV